MKERRKGGRGREGKREKNERWRDRQNEKWKDGGRWNRVKEERGERGRTGGCLVSWLL